MNALKISEQQAMESGLQRAQKLAAVHGINSRQVLDCCVRWGAIIDDIRAEKEKEG